jgi:hypothetical protein
MTAVDAFWMRQGVLEMLHAPFWHRYADGFAASNRGEATGVAPGGWKGTGEELTARLLSTLNLAETYYVAPQMHRLVAAAAEDWPADEVVTEEDFPTVAGFMWLPGAGLGTLDIRGQMMHVNAITWHLRSGEVMLTWWAHKRHDSPHRRASFGDWSMLPDLTPWAVTTMRVGEPLPRTLQMGTLLPPEVSDQIRWHETDAGLAMTIPEGWSPEQLTPHASPDPVTAWLVSALRIMQQPLADVRQTGLPANVRRSLQRRQHKLRQTRVTVIDFRRPPEHRGDGSGREFSHRFLRRGHWRRQPYKRDDGTWDRRRIWIHPVIVGPSDKPFLLRDHVNALRR